MTRRILVNFTIAALATAGLTLAAAPQTTTATGDKLLAAAKHKATDEGDVPAAIEMYKQIASTAGANRVLAASALLGMAGGYEVLGKLEAREAYEKILKDYPDVVAVASVARTKVAAMGQKSTSAKAVLVSNEWASSYLVSTDGSYATFLTDHNDVAIRDLKSGAVTLLTTKAATTESYADFPTPSPDGKSIVYGWWDSDSKRDDVRIVARNGGQPRTIYAGDRVMLSILGWSRDGRGVFTYLRNGDAPASWNASERSWDLVLIPTNGGAPQLVRRFEPGPGAGPGNGPRGRQLISPDGRFLLGSRPAAAGGSEQDIFVFSLESGHEASVARHPADDYPLAWHPDGTRILFASDRGGDFGIWTMRVVDGRPEGTAVSVQPHTGFAVPMGFTGRNDFYYGAYVPMRDVLVATLDPATGMTVGAPRSVEGRFTGGMSGAAWSPDGQHLAYVQDTDLRPARPGIAKPQVRKLAIHSLATGEMKLLSTPFLDITGPTWARDGRTVLVQARAGGSLFRIDVESGAMTAILDQETHGSAPAFPVLSPDGGYLYGRQPRTGAARMNSEALGDSIVRRDLKTGTQTTLIESASQFSLSPDGRFVSVLKFPTTSGMLVIPSSGGEPLRLAPGVADWSLAGAAAWAADGRSVFVVRYTRDQPYEIWQVPVDGSQPRSTGITSNRPLARISAHPDGRQLAISQAGNRFETWVLSNLPTLGAK